MTTRSQLIFSLFDPTGHGLEIGPGFNPLMPRSAGYDVETLDHASREALVEKYRHTPNVDVNLIEAVDHVVDGPAIASTVNKPAAFDFIVASHVIEHTIDFIGFLRDCAWLLKPSGKLVLAVPDKRFSFDVMRPLTSTGSVLQAHLERRTRHSAGVVFDELAYNVVREGQIAWPSDATGETAFFRSLNDALEVFESYRASQQFLDLHAWQFTPSSFRLIVEDLFLIGYSPLREDRYIPGTAGEFFISLSAEAAGPDASRIELAQQAMKEQHAVRL